MDRHSQSFFGQTTGIRVESPSKTEPFIFLKLVKKKVDGTWEKLSLGEGKTIKCSLEEMTMIYKVLKRKLPSWKTYHQYKEIGTNIKFNWDKFNGKDCLMVTIGEYTRQFSIAQAEVFRRLMKHLLKEKIKFATSGTNFKNNKEAGESYSANTKVKVPTATLPSQEPIQLSEESIRTDTASAKGEIKAETEKALLLVFDSGNEKWIPKSTIKSKYTSQIGLAQTFTIDKWVLQKNQD